MSTSGAGVSGSVHDSNPESKSTATVPAAVGPKGWGSFHSEREDERVEVLIAKSAAEYKPPKFPIDTSISAFPISVPEAMANGTTKVAFGADTKKALFFLESDCCFLNHGAFGAALRPVIEVARRWQSHMESQPLRFIDRQLLPLLIYATREMAAFVKADPQDLVLIPNATTGLNSVFRSFKFVPGDRVLTLDIGYGSTKKMLKYAVGQAAVVHDELHVSLPIQSESELLKLVERYLKKHVIMSNESGSADDTASSSSSSSATATATADASAGDASPAPQRRSHVALAVFDYITSNTGVVLPVYELTRLCERYGVPVMIDGAHSLGSMNVDLQTLKPAYYVANAHKWMCSAKGCAILYVDRSLQSSVAPLNISHGYGGGFTSDFVWTGLQDYGPWLSLLTTLEFWRACGVNRIRSHIRNTIQDAIELLTNAWGTETLAPVEMYGPMATIRVPGSRQPKHGDENNELQDALYFKYNIECPVKLLEGRLYVRISAHIHNHIGEYRRLAEAMLELRPRLSAEEDAADIKFVETAAKVCATGGCG